MARKPKAAPPAAPAPKKPRKKGSGGAYGFKATAEQRLLVESLVATGNPQWLIAEELNISEDTLQRHFRPEIERGKARIHGRIGAMIARQALAGCRTSQIFWMKSQAGWRTTDRVEHSGPDGAPIPIAAGPRTDLSKLTRAELEAWEALALKALPAPEAPGA